MSAVLASLLTAVIGLASTAVVTAPSETVVMLKLASTPEAQRHERGLYDELGLVLDGFGLVSTVPDDPTFADAPLPNQLEQVFALAQAEGAVAVVWLARDRKGRLLLELVAQRTGRTLIRSIEGGAGGTTERKLALAVRELLATAFLFEPQERQPPPVSALVTELKTRVLQADAPAPPPAPVEAPPPAWSAHGELGAALGVVGEVGFQPQTLGALRLTRAFAAFVRLGVSFEAAGSRGFLRAGDAVSWWRFSPAALAVVYRDFERVSLGLGVQLGASAVRLELFSASSGSSVAWALRADLRVEAAVRLFGALWLSFTPGISWLSHQVVVSDGPAVVYVSPKLALRLAAGLELRF